MTSNLDPASLLKGMVGLIQLVENRDDVSPALREALLTNHRYVDALAYLDTLSHAGEGEPDFWALHAAGGMHIGLWSDRETAERVLKKEPRGTTMTALYRATPRPDAPQAEGEPPPCAGEGHDHPAHDWRTACLNCGVFRGSDLYATPRPDTAEGERELTGAEYEEVQRAAIDAYEAASPAHSRYSATALRRAIDAARAAERRVRAISKPAPQAEGVSEAMVERALHATFGKPPTKIVAMLTLPHFGAQIMRAALEAALARPNKGEGTADPEGWIEWKGGERPVAKDVSVQVRYLNGHTETSEAGDYYYSWSIEANKARAGIVAYRLAPTQGKDEG